MEGKKPNLPWLYKVKHRN